MSVFAFLIRSPNARKTHQEWGAKELRHLIIWINLFHYILQWIPASKQQGRGWVEVRWRWKEGWKEGRGSSRGLERRYLCFPTVIAGLIFKSNPSEADKLSVNLDVWPSSCRQFFLFITTIVDLEKRGLKPQHQSLNLLQHKPEFPRFSGNDTICYYRCLCSFW